MRSRSNYSPTGGVPASLESLEDRMAAYDQLPPRLRQALDDCPIEQSAISTLRMWHMVAPDIDRAVFIFNTTVEKVFPGYTPPRRRTPRPISATGTAAKALEALAKRPSY